MKARLQKCIEIGSFLSLECIVVQEHWQFQNRPKLGKKQIFGWTVNAL
jgi:hypothetical protein